MATVPGKSHRNGITMMELMERCRDDLTAAE